MLQIQLIMNDIWFKIDRFIIPLEKINNQITVVLVIRLKSRFFKTCNNISE